MLNLLVAEQIDNKYIMLFEVINLFVENKYIELKVKRSKDINKEIVVFANFKKRNIQLF